MDVAAAVIPGAESAAAPVDWKARAKLRFSPTGVLLVEYEGIESPAHDEHVVPQEDAAAAAYPPYAFPYTSDAVQSSRCAACNRTFASANAVLQHLRDHAAHKDGPEAQEAAYVLQCQEAGLLADASADPTSPAWGWSNKQQQQQHQQQYQGWWWQQDGAAAGEGPHTAPHAGSGSSPSNMSCNEHVDLDEDASQAFAAAANGAQAYNGARQGGVARPQGQQGRRGTGNGKPAARGAQQQQGQGQGQGQLRAGGKRQPLYQPPPPALNSNGYDSAFPPLAGGLGSPATPSPAPGASWAATAKVVEQQQEQQEQQQEQPSGIAATAEAASAAADKPAASPSSPTSAGLRAGAPAWTPSA